MLGTWYGPKTLQKFMIIALGLTDNNFIRKIIR